VERKTHVAFAAGAAAVAAWLLGLCPVDARAVWFLSWALAGSTLPDADLRRLHRMLLHNIFVLIAAAAVVAAALTWLGVGPGAWLAAAGLAVGMASHVFLDAFTVRGVAILFPLSRRRYRLLSLRSSSAAANALFYTLGALALAAYILKCGHLALQ